MSEPNAGAGTVRRAHRVRRAAARLLRRVPGLGWVGRRLLPLPFDPRRRYGTELTPRRLAKNLSRGTRRLAIGRLRRLPCFHTGDYLSMHPDVAGHGMDPCFHALFIGGFEERALFQPEALARSFHLPSGPPPSPPPVPPPADGVALYVSSLGNVFMREIAEDIAACLRAAGVAAEVRDETSAIEARPAFSVFVAPHEFFLLGGGLAWVRDEVIAGSIMLNTEQAQTRWFGRALPFLLASRGVIELCPQTAALFAATGLPSLLLTPAPPSAGAELADADREHPLFRVLQAAARARPSPTTPFAARPIDVAFFGTESRNREAWLARNAGRLAEFETVIHYRRERRGTLDAGSPDAALTRLARHVSGHAKIVLNLHRDAFGYLEWHRIVRQGIAAGAVIVSEPCLPHPLLAPGVHYLEGTSRELPELIAWLLQSEDGRRAAARVQAEARALLETAVTPRATAASVLGFLAAHALAAPR